MTAPGNVREQQRYWIAFFLAVILVTIASLASTSGLIYYELFLVLMLHFWSLSSAEGRDSLLVSVVLGIGMGLLLVSFGASLKSAVKVYCLLCSLTLIVRSDVLAAFLQGSLIALTLATSIFGEALGMREFTEGAEKLAIPFFPLLAACAFLSGDGLVGIVLTLAGAITGFGQAYRGMLVCSAVLVLISLLWRGRIRTLLALAISALPILAFAASPLILGAMERDLLEPTASNVERVGTNVLTLLVALENQGFPAQYESGLEAVNEFHADSKTSPHNLVAELILSAGGMVAIPICLLVSLQLFRALRDSNSIALFYFLFLLAYAAALHPFNFWTRHIFYLATALGVFRSRGRTENMPDSQEVALTVK